MTEWWSGLAVPFDLESDGKDPAEARIITAAVGFIKPGTETAMTTWMAKPERPIPDEAIGVHGITNEFAQEHGRDRKEVVREVVETLARLTALPHGWAKVPVVAHNAIYDLTLLDREMRRLGIGRLTSGEGFSSEHGPLPQMPVTIHLDRRMIGAFYVIDTMVLDKELDTFRPGPVGPDGEKLGGRNKLTRVAEHYGVPISEDDAHAADADALAAARVAWVIAKRCRLAQIKTPEGHGRVMLMYGDRTYPGAAREIADKFARAAGLSLAELHDWQRRVALDQADGFREYCIANPKYVAEKQIDIDGIDGRWPLRPLTDRTKTTDITTTLV